jgi:transcriptional regulator with XRE-family HTH domain
MHATPPSSPLRSSSATLRDTLRKAVEASPLSKEELAEKAGLSRKSLYNLLEGRADPRLSSVEALAHALGLDLFVAPRALAQMRIHETAKPGRSSHSTISKLLADHGRDVKAP